jgi:TonB family protein
MPTSAAPTEVNEPRGPGEKSLQDDGAAQERRIPGSILGIDTVNDRDVSQREGEARETGERAPDEREARSPLKSSSRWIDYDTHELLQVISDLEDERRWARLREGVLWAVLVHILVLFALFLIPKYLLKMVPVVQTSSIKDNQNFTYLDTPTLPAPKPVKPLPKTPLIDRQTMEEMKRQAVQPPAPSQPPPPPAAQQQIPAPVEARPQPTQPIPPTPQSQAPEAPRPQAVPAKPNFALGSPNTADQLREDMQKAMQNRGQPSYGSQGPSGGLSMHPGAGTGQPDILSDTQGVDFSSWLARWHYVTQRTWDPLIPDEVNPPILKSGVVAVRFKVLPNGQVIDMTLDGRSGDTALDRAAWGAITGSSYPALPREFHGPYLELRAYFLYNMQPR